MKQFSIDLKAQKTDVESYDWVVDDGFFAEVGGFAVRRGRVNVSLEVRRILADDYKLNFSFSGDVQVTCDRCLEPMRLPIEGESELRVRLGQNTNDDDEPVADTDGVVDLAWHIYEMIVLQIPLRHVHDEGACEGETAETLKSYLTNDGNTEKQTDQRWNELRKILDNN